MTAFDLEAFARLQARPSEIFRRPVRPLPPPPPIRYSAAPCVPLPIGRPRTLAAVRYPRARPAAPTGLDGLADLLTSALGFQRYEPANNYNAHRAYPSAQSLFPVEAFVVRGPRAWHYDAARHALRPVGETADGDPAGAGAMIAVLGRPGQLPDYYRELRWALTLCEAGHAVQATAAVAQALGYAAGVHTDFDDAALLSAIGAGPADGWLPAALIGPLSTPPADSSTRIGSAPSGGVPLPDDTVLAEDPVLHADRLAWPASHSLGSDDPGSDPRPKAGSDAASEMGDETGASWDHVLFTRSAGHSRGGFTASPATLPRQALTSALAACRHAARQDWSGLGVRLCLAVERVEALADGLYAWSPEAGDLTLLAPGAHLGAVQSAYLYPSTVMRVDTCNVAIMFLADYPSLIGSHGARGLRLSQLAVGALAQAAGLAMAAHGAFLRPARSFDPDRLGELADAKDGETVAYLALCGQARLDDLLLDLRV
ncbi:nitroreductase family protein [Hamadaea tsunoensis]|uniref:hypothetical protein n=1 Tax=Hamadaea tsunoensis TaxID=53368 RepID=UPI0004119A8C|nr:hypothetical protein [Hamadaea tsunoensis]